MHGALRTDPDPVHLTDHTARILSSRAVLACPESRVRTEPV